MTNLSIRPNADRLSWLMATFIFVHGIAVTSFAQDKSVRREAFRLFELNRMHEAEPLLAAYCKGTDKDAEALYRWAQSLFATNNLDRAITQFRLIRNTHKRYADRATLMLAKAHHHQYQFADAIKFYKLFLKQSDRNNDHYAEAINNVKRCAQGIRLALPSDDVFLENMGSNVNSVFDDFAPIGSPNIESRIYFSSNRTERVDDQFADDGTLITSTHSHDCDMYATEIDNGAWSTAFPLNDDLNTKQQEILQDFSKDGMVAYFTKGQTFEHNTFYLDSFASETQAAIGVPWDQLQLSSDEQIRGIHFFSDSTLLYSSNSRHGFGGYDLYISVLGPDGWTSGINMGPKINGQFDEITPFLAADGRTLYYSSNCLSSIGGQDIFYSRFDERLLQWVTPKNISLPINSPGDDVHFRISPSGQTAHFSSDRKTGRGGQDIYAAYFKKPIQAQLVRSVPPIFYMVKDFQLFSESLVVQAENGAVEQHTLLDSEWDLESILYREDDQILTAQNKAKLDNLIGLLKTYPHIQLEILGHSDQSSVSNFDLFFSIKRAERIAGYLEADGIDLNRVYLKGFGGSYPYALNTIAGHDNKAGRFFNRRIDFRILNTDKLPITINLELPNLATAQIDGRLDSFYQMRNDLYYRVEYAVLDQLFKGDLIGKYADPGIEKMAGTSKYHYTSGIFSSFALALQHLAVIKEEGFDNAKIVPYQRGRRLKTEEITDGMIDQYPDLKEFMIYLK